jgi:hypothetical protein
MMQKQQYASLNYTSFSTLLLSAAPGFSKSTTEHMQLFIRSIGDSEDNVFIHTAALLHGEVRYCGQHEEQLREIAVTHHNLCPTYSPPRHQ